MRSYVSVILAGGCPSMGTFCPGRFCPFPDVKTVLYETGVSVSRPGVIVSIRDGTMEHTSKPHKHCMSEYLIVVTGTNSATTDNESSSNGNVLPCIRYVKSTIGYSKENLKIHRGSLPFGALGLY